jgi:hypothetical protein
MKIHCYDAYQQERNDLSEKEIDLILESGRAWNLAPTLANGGVAIFPHTYLHVCGKYIAACVHAALDSGADQVLALGVLHSITEEFIQARARERAHENLSDLPYRGVHGPNLALGDYWQREYSLLSFEFLWHEEVKRRGKKAPKLILRYPYLVNRQPGNLPGIKELEAHVKRSALVATCDFCHHGVAYGMDRNSSLTGEKALQFARQNILNNLAILQTGDLEKYYQQCLEIRSDSLDVCSVLSHLLGPIHGALFDLAIGDTSPLYEGAPTPSWVACALISLDIK